MTFQMPQADENGWVSTLNNMGYMSLVHDSYTQDFLDFCRDNKNVKVFEGGAAYGEVTLAALESGAAVVANDKEKKHLDLLASRAHPSHRSSLTLYPGSLPHDVDFPEETFDAILTSRMIHFLTGYEINLCLQKFYSWLKPNGKLFLIAESPYLRCYSSFIPTYEMRKKNGDKWPGFIEDTSIFRTIRYNNIPNFIHFLDVETLSSACEENGFAVEKSEMLNRVEFPSELRLDGRESVAIKAIKL